MARRRTAEQLTLPASAPGCPSDPGLDAVLGGSVRTTLSPAARAGDPGVRERAGRTAQRAGKAWEARMGEYLRGALEVAVIVWFLKIETPLGQKAVRAPSGSWEWQLVRAAKAAADFGAINGFGHAVVIECKSTEAGRLPRSEIRPPQVRQLDATAATAHGVALLAVQFRHPDREAYGAREYLIPWRAVPWTVARTAEGLDEADAAPWRLAGGALFDRLRGR